MLQTQCLEYQRAPGERSEAGRQAHLEAIHVLLSLYRRRDEGGAVPEDADALNEGQVDAVELNAPGATEEG
jgi:hypothetical protein